MKNMHMGGVFTSALMLPTLILATSLCATASGQHEVLLSNLPDGGSVQYLSGSGARRFQLPGEVHKRRVHGEKLAPKIDTTVCDATLT
jgi:hypothetical protein